MGRIVPMLPVAALLSIAGTVACVAGVDLRRPSLALTAVPLVVLAVAYHASGRRRSGRP